MKYSIHTLENEVANLRQVIRKCQGTVANYEDSRGGFYPDTNKIKRNIKELEKAIDVLNQAEFKEPEIMELLQMDE